MNLAKSCVKQINEKYANVIFNICISYNNMSNHVILQFLTITSMHLQEYHNFKFT